MRFCKNAKSLGVGGRYFRFNVTRGLGDIGVDEHDQKSLSGIAAASERYLKEPMPMVGERVQKFLCARSQQQVLVNASERDKYLGWLPFIDSSRRHNDARQFRTTKTTGDWFLAHGFDTWKTQKGSFYWLCAKAGSGKTVLSSAIIDKIQSQELGALAYFYFSFAFTSDVRLEQFKYTLLTQIIGSLSTTPAGEEGGFPIPRAFRHLYDKYASSKHPLSEHTDAVFPEVLPQSGSTYIVVDALDECPSREDRRQIVHFLADLSRDPNHNLHIIITSRTEDDIERAMASREILTVPFPADRVNVDIRNHLLNAMDTVGYEGWDENLRQTVISYLTEHADGVFRWADLQLKELERKSRPKDVEKLLRKLPRALEEAYERMLKRIEDVHGMAALSILRWLAFSKRPLLLAEVNEIAAFEYPMGDGDDGHDDHRQVVEVTFSVENRFQDMSEVRDMLTGLATVATPNKTPKEISTWGDVETSEVESTATSGEEQRMVFSLAHFSVKEYLQSPKVQPAKFRLTPESSHSFIFQCCLAYIRYYSDSFDGEKIEGRAPFVLLGYACKFIWAHRELLGKELESSGDQKGIRYPGGLPVASFLGDVDVVRLLLDSGSI
ncbi:hypothetical protein B0J18DRAFT_85657 [Chaetomium sp. MPI-SDFR-AT-0129]|nr:hypothetical protein B0J18DRAFT_85657 [Chaetomium sp. MPI-SDFR-AT-0129]